MMRAVIAAFILLASSAAIAAAPAESFKIVSEDATAERRIVAVRLPARLAEPDLRRLAEDIQKRSRAATQRTLFRFHLPGMPLDQTPWAVAAFQPDLKLTIHGLKFDEEQIYAAEVHADRRQLVGAWLTSPPAIPGRVSIFRDKGGVFAEWRLRSGLKTIEQLTENKVARGRLYTIKPEGAAKAAVSAPDDGAGKSDGSAQFLVTAAGELELRDRDTLIATGEIIPLDKNAVTTLANSAPKTPVTSKPPTSAVDETVTGRGKLGQDDIQADAPSASPQPVTSAAQPAQKPRVARTAAVRKVRSAQGLVAKRDDGPVMRMNGQ